MFSKSMIWLMGVRRRLAWVVGSAVFVLLLTAFLLPAPVSWAYAFSDCGYPPAIVKAYGVAVRRSRPSGIPVTSVTYETLVQSVSRTDVEVVFIPRPGLVRLFFSEPAEEIHVVIRRPWMKVVQYRLQES